jgi:hypothetical protein
MSCEEAAGALGLPSERLVRVLRGLVWADLLSIDEEGRYSLTESGRALLDDGPLGKAQDIRFQAEFFYRAWAGLAEHVISGAIPFDHEHGCGVFDLLQRDPVLAELYAAPMASRSTEYSRIIAAHPTVVQARTIVDVGGGHGRLLTDVLSANPQASGIVFDLPVMRAPAMEVIERAGLSSRCRFESGNVFRAVPAGADVYLLKWVVHDWPDREAVAILMRCAEAMRGESKLLVIERLLPESPAAAARSGLVQADLNMLCLSGGAERTLAEYRRLIRAGGLTMSECERVEDFYGFHAMTCARL